MERVKAQVGIIMGSDSDLHIMKPAAEVMEELGISYEMRIISAHRTPEYMIRYGKSINRSDKKIIIAGAGGAAHLPGMIASVTRRPVIGVPIESHPLGGVGALFSIVQMPKGEPVATMAINGAENAGLYAARHLAAFDRELDKRLETLIKRYTRDSIKKDRSVKEDWRAHLDKLIDPQQ